MDAPEGCVLYLSCTYAGVLLAVLLALFMTCVAIYYLERRQRARFPGLPDGRLVVASTSPQKAPGVAARVLSDSLLQDARVQPRATTVNVSQAPSTTFSSRALPSRPTVAPRTAEDAEMGLVLNRRQQQSLREEEMVLEHDRSRSVSESAGNGQLSVGMEVLVVATDEARGWCGRFGGQREAWFSDADSVASGFKMSPGDVVTVVGLRLNSWCGACKGNTTYFTLPADSIGRGALGSTPYTVLRR
jgi:hypothetical protein